MNNSKKWIIGSIALLVIIMAGIYSYHKYSTGKKQSFTNNNVALPLAENSTTTAVNTVASTQPPSVKPSAINQSKAPSPAKYTEAVNQYQGRRIQFDANCRAVPFYMTFKNPATIMLDNRSDNTRKITINGKTYTISPYGYTVVTVSAKTLPSTIGVACDKQYNVATILLEK